MIVENNTNAVVFEIVLFELDGILFFSKKIIPLLDSIPQFSFSLIIQIFYMRVS